MGNREPAISVLSSVLEPSAEQLGLDVIGDQLVAFIAAQPAGLTAVRAACYGQYMVHVLGDGAKVADDGDEAAALGLAAESFQSLGERVGVEGAEPLVEEEGVEAATAATSEFDQGERQGKAGGVPGAV
jgi:hypothetical protein